jgi:SNF2 family DNA or RNA helicase
MKDPRDTKKTDTSPLQDETGSWSAPLAMSHPLIASLPSRKELDDKSLTTDQLTEILKSVIAEGILEPNPYRWRLALLLGNFQNVHGETISGKQLLEALTERSFRDENPRSRVTLEKINQKDGFSLCHVYDTFLKKHFRVLPISLTLDSEPRVTWTPSATFDIEHLDNNDPQRLQLIAEFLCDEIFHGDVFVVSKDDFLKVVILLSPSPDSASEAKEISGKDLLEALSRARFERDHLGAPLPQNVLRMRGYTLDDSLLEAKAAIICARKPDAESRLEVSVSPLTPVVNATDPVLFEEPLKQVFELKFQGYEREVSYRHLMPLTLTGSDGVKVSAQQLLAQYAMARYMRDHPDEPLKLSEILEHSEYKLDKTLSYFKKEVLKLASAQRYPKSFASFSDDEIQEFVQNQNLEGIIKPLRLHPALLVEGLTLLSPNAFEGREITEFVTRYIGLQVQSERRFNHDLERNEPDRFAYIRALLAALEQHQRIEDIQARFDQHLRLYIRTLRPAFEYFGDSIIKDLFSEAEKPTHHSREDARKLFENLHRQAGEYFKGVSIFALHHTKTPPFRYQQEGARFLATRQAAILADDVGLGKTYQAAAAALAIRARRILWVTTAPAKDVVRRELLEHFDLSQSDVAVLNENKRARSRQIQELQDERFVITNYETIVALHHRSPHEFERITAGLDVLILDEGQLADNSDSLRSQALRLIQAQHKWVLSATPYQNRLDNLWTIVNLLAPEEFPDQGQFRDTYTASSDALMMLHYRLAEIMLRRTKEEMVARFEDPAAGTFEEQLAKRAPRLPELRTIEPSVEGYVDLNPEQEETIAWMISEFRDWADLYNTTIAQDGEAIELSTISPLLKFFWIHQAIYQPQRVGLACGNPALEQAVLIAKNRADRGEKSLVWAWNTAMIEEAVDALKDHGAVRFDGTLSNHQKQESRQSFQDDPDTKILVANYQSGGVAQTFTAAHVAIFAQLPLAFPKLLQVEGRHHRVIGRNNSHRAKRFSDVVYVLPRFRQEFLESQRDQQLKEWLSHGTLAEQTFQRLAGGRILYSLVMEGLQDSQNLEQDFQSSLFRAMGLSERRNSDLGGNLSVGKKRLFEMAQKFLPVWNIVRQDGERETELAALVDGFRRFIGSGSKISEIFTEFQKAPLSDLRLAVQAVTVENKFLREQIVEKLPVVLRRAYEDGKATLSEDCYGSVEGVLLKAVKLDSHHELSSIVKELSTFRDTAHIRRLRERFAVGLLGIARSSDAKQILTQFSHFFQAGSLEERVSCLYRFGLMVRVSPRVCDEVRSSASGVTTSEAFNRLIHAALHNSLEDFAERERGAIQELLQADETNEWNGTMEHLAALVVGWESHADEAIIEKSREVVGAIIDGHFDEWRRRDGAGCIDAPGTTPAFWNAFHADCRLVGDVVSLDVGILRESLQEEYELLRERARDVIARVEGPITTATFSRLDSLRGEPLTQESRQINSQLRVLGKILGEEVLGAEDLDVVATLPIPSQEESPEARRASLKALSRDLHTARGWLFLHSCFARESASTRESIEPRLLAEVEKALRHKANYYQRAGHAVIAEMLSGFATRTNGLDVAKSEGVRYSIEETASPAILSRMGCLEDNLTNCFNPNGNPVFTQFVLGALGSKNMKLLVVRDSEQRIVAHAMMKLRVDESKHPVLYLERGLSAGAYDFRREMLELLWAKAEHIGETSGIRPRVMGQIYGSRRDTDPEIRGTGCFTTDEYVEAVFHLRRSTHVRHYAREFTPPNSAQPLHADERREGTDSTQRDDEAAAHPFVSDHDANDVDNGGHAGAGA